MADGAVVGPEYRQYLIERFEGEVEGQAFFQALSVHAGDAEMQRKWALLAQLEAETGAHIGKALKALGVEPAPSAACVERGRQLAARFSRMQWADFMNAFRPALQAFVAEFSAAERLAPAGSREHRLLRHITRHEQALLAFAVRARQQDGDASVQAVRALLGVPIEE